MKHSNIQFFIPLTLVILAVVGYLRNGEKTKNLYLETITNIGIFLGFQMIMRHTRPLTQLGFERVQSFSGEAIPANLTTFVVSLIAVDLTYYWVHRLSHKFGFMWSLHSVHHSSDEFNFSTALRLPWLAPLINWVFFIPLILIGLPLKLVAVSHLINLWFQFFVHTQIVDKLGVLDSVFNTPSNHRVHHSCETQYLDKNFGGILMIWDRIFGTYCREKSVVKQYGITGPQVDSQNPFVVNLKPLYQYIVSRIK